MLHCEVIRFDVQDVVAASAPVIDYGVCVCNEHVITCSLKGHKYTRWYGYGEYSEEYECTYKGPVHKCEW